MKIIFGTLFEATALMDRINRGNRYEAYFKTVKGEVHVIVQEKAFTVIENGIGE